MELLTILSVLFPPANTVLNLLVSSTPQRPSRSLSRSSNGERKTIPLPTRSLAAELRVGDEISLYKSHKYCV